MKASGTPPSVIPSGDERHTSSVIPSEADPEGRRSRGAYKLGITLIERKRFSQIPPLRFGSRLRSGRDDKCVGVYPRYPTAYCLLPNP